MFYRYNKFLDIIASSRTGLAPEKLPPTKSSSSNHSYRVHLQVIVWETMETDALDPHSWGWILTENGTLKPVATENQIAPEDLLKYVRCKCKLSSAKPCNTNTCSCKKNGLPCVQACGDCRGEGCYNSEKVG